MRSLRLFQDAILFRVHLDSNRTRVKSVCALTESKSTSTPNAPSHCLFALLGYQESPVDEMKQNSVTQNNVSGYLSRALKATYHQYAVEVRLHEVDPRFELRDFLVLVLLKSLLLLLHFLQFTRHLICW